MFAFCFTESGWEGWKSVASAGEGQNCLKQYAAYAVRNRAGTLVDNPTAKGAVPRSGMGRLSLSRQRCPASGHRAYVWEHADIFTILECRDSYFS